MTLRIRTSLALLLVLGAGPARAEVNRRKIVDLTGDFVIIGNTLGQDCSDAAPRAGTVSNCREQTANDASPDVFWRSETSSAAANPTITADLARSTAVLTLPAGAQVRYAYLYWFGIVFDPPGDTEATLERPGVANLVATATVSYEYVQLTPLATRPEYQETLNYFSGADVTAFVAAQGSGPYRVSGVSSHPLAEDVVNVSEIGWTLVVFYERAGDPPRNLALFDGLDRVVGSTVGVSLEGFRVPEGAFDAKLGVLGLDGEVAGSQLRFGPASPLNASDALADPLNPANRFFNGTHSYLGEAVSNVGDLPQTTGAANSFAGIDLDVVDITAELTAGQTTAAVEVAAGVNDGIQTMLFVTSITTLKPDFGGSTKTASLAEARPPRTGERIVYEIVLPNRGNDTATEATFLDVLPAGLDFVSGSLEIVSGPGAGLLTDMAGDDRGSWDPVTRNLTVQLGMGATPTLGGRIAPGESTTVRFATTVAVGAPAYVDNQAKLSTRGLGGAPREITFSDGDAVTPGPQPTRVDIEQPETDAGVPDAGATSADASSPDASGDLDGGVPGGIDAGEPLLTDDGCDCSTTHGARSEAPFGELALLLLAFTSARRRLRDPTSRVG